MKKAAGFLFMAVLCFSFTACVDIFQHITRLDNGTEQNTIKITLSKTVFEMAAGMSGETVDYDELFDDSELTPMDITEYNQFSASIKKVNDPMEVGYLIDMNINYRSRDTVNELNASNISFIPKYNGNKTTIHIDALSDNSDFTDDNEMAAVFLATGKYKLLLSKSCINKISKVILKTNEGEMEYAFLDLYDEYLIEIPILVFFMDAVELEIYS